MTRSTAEKASEAADAVLEWLSGQTAQGRLSASAPLVGVTGSGNDLARTAAEPPSDAVGLDSPTPVAPSHELQVNAARGDGQKLRLAAPDWLHHCLTISGSAANVQQFRVAAAGAGIIPWQLDPDQLEEDYFHLLIAPGQRSLSIAGARIFARQLRQAVALRHAVAVARVGHSQACPFDLFSLVPVPSDILALGPDDPRALAWLLEHWGTTEALRHVTEEIDQDAADGIQGTAANENFRLRFWSADWTPWRALARIAADWPSLRFETRPIYEVP